MSSFGSKMMQISPKFLVAAALGALLAMPLAQAADVEQGRQKAEQICASCHGKDGNTPIDPTYPRLAGQHRDYLRHALIDYQTDQRKNPIMGAMAKQLSRADVENLAAFYESLPGTMSHRR